MRTLGEPSKPAVFIPDFNAQFIVRVEGNPALWIEPLRAALAEVDPTSATDVRPLNEAVAGALFPMRVAAGFLGSLSCVGLALSLIGVYGSVSYAVSRRTREFGIRAALGASRSKVVQTAAKDGLAVLVSGMAIGAPLGLSVIHPLSGLFPASFDPWAPAPLFGIVLALFLTCAIAIYLPARRAASFEPVETLRHDH